MRLTPLQKPSQVFDPPGGRAIADVAGGARSFTCPSSLTATIVIDSGRAVDESDEDNNRASIDCGR